MRDRGIKIVIRSLLILFAATVIIGYTYFRARPYLSGPKITISSPANGTTVTDPILTVSGTTERISTIHFNGRKIFIDKDNAFKETVLLFPGYNIITVDATDRFNQSVTQHIKIIYKGT